MSSEKSLLLFPQTFMAERADAFSPHCLTIVHYKLKIIM